MEFWCLVNPPRMPLSMCRTFTLYFYPFKLDISIIYLLAVGPLLLYYVSRIKDY